MLICDILSIFTVRKIIFQSVNRHFVRYAPFANICYIQHNYCDIYVGLHVIYQDKGLKMKYINFLFCYINFIFFYASRKSLFFIFCHWCTNLIIYNSIIDCTQMIWVHSLANYGQQPPTHLKCTTGFPNYQIIYFNN